jgi:hypothetical protein
MVLSFPDRTPADLSLVHDEVVLGMGFDKLQAAAASGLKGNFQRVLDTVGYKIPDVDSMLDKHVVRPEYDLAIEHHRGKGVEPFKYQVDPGSLRSTLARPHKVGSVTPCPFGDPEDFQLVCVFERVWYQTMPHKLGVNVAGNLRHREPFLVRLAFELPVRAKNLDYIL